MKHLIYSQDLTKAEYLEIQRRFQKFIDEGIPNDLCRGKIVATLFFQPSTRTMNMFQSAMLRAGGGWIGVTGESAQSMSRGETLEEIIQEYGNFADCIALRHSDEDSSERAAKSSYVPIINSGSGLKEHAVTAPLLMCFIKHYLNRSVEGLKIGIYGTPEINRAIKSLVPSLGMFHVDLIIDDLGYFPLPIEVEERAWANGIKSLRYDKLDNFIGDVDVLVVTRWPQNEIITLRKFPKEKEEMVLKSYKPINVEHMKKMRKNAILFMIRPRIFEIEKEVDSDPRAVYVQQEPYVEVGLAIITYLLGIKV